MRKKELIKKIQELIGSVETLHRENELYKKENEELKAELELLKQNATAVSVDDNVNEAEGFKVGNKLAHEQGFASVYEAMAIKNHANLPETMDIGINAMGLGDVGFIFASYEMYSGNAAWVREHSPYPMTFVITCCNGSNGYLPSEIGYEINCYEAYNSNVGRGAGEKLADLFIKMLSRLKNSLNI